MFAFPLALLCGESNNQNIITAIASHAMVDNKSRIVLGEEKIKRIGIAESMPGSFGLTTLRHNGINYRINKWQRSVALNSWARKFVKHNTIHHSTLDFPKATVSWPSAIMFNLKIYLKLLYWCQ